MDESEWKRLENGKGGGGGTEGTDDDETTLLPDHESSDEDGEGDGDGMDEGSLRSSIRPTLWMILSVTATLAGRRLLTSGFRELAVLLC